MKKKVAMIFSSKKSHFEFQSTKFNEVNFFFLIFACKLTVSENSFQIMNDLFFYTFNSIQINKRFSKRVL